MLALDQAGWHKAKALKVPANITLVPLPSYSPRLNPLERVWEYLRERFLSHRLYSDYDAVVDAAYRAWNRLTAEPGRVLSLCAYPESSRSLHNGAGMISWRGWEQLSGGRLGIGPIS